MKNQAAQTMPELPYELEMLVARLYADAYQAGHDATVEGHFIDLHPNDRDTYWLDLLRENEDVQNYAAALSQTAGVPLERAVADLAATVADEWLEMFAAIPGLEKYERYTYGPAVTLLRDQLREMLAAVPAANGGEDECSANFTGHKFGPHGPKGATQCEWCGEEPQPPAGASVSERARAILSQAYRNAGFDKAAEWVLHVDLDNELYVLDHAVIRALEQALTQQRGAAWPLNTKPENGWTFDPAFLERVMKLAEQQDSGEFAPSLEGVETVLLALQAMATTPQPGAEALRELVQSWRFMSDPYHGKCADELESLLARGGKEDWFGDVLSTLGDSVPLEKGD